MPRTLGGLLAGLLALTTCGSPPPAPTHLVIDAGSSGTRFCVFAIRPSCPADGSPCRCGSPAPIEAAGAPACTSVAAPDGLAALPEAAAVQVVADGLARLGPERARLADAALLGTGGFREADEGKRLRTITALSKFFARQLPGTAVHVLTGDDEGRLAWLAVREREGSQRHAILETGGASVQYAIGQAGQVQFATSVPTGMRTTSKKLSAKFAAQFAACYPFGGPGAKTDFERCRSLVLQFGLGTYPLTPSARPDHDAAVPLYALGRSWQAVFELLGTKDELRAGDLEAAGRKLCAERRPLESAQLRDAHFAERCYLLAYESALLQKIGAERVRFSTESWPRGAAVSGEFFESCRQK